MKPNTILIDLAVFKFFLILIGVFFIRTVEIVLIPESILDMAAAKIAVISNPDKPLGSSLII